MQAYTKGQGICKAIWSQWKFSVKNKKGHIISAHWNIISWGLQIFNPLATSIWYRSLSFLSAPYAWVLPCLVDELGSCSLGNHVVFLMVTSVESCSSRKALCVETSVYLEPSRVAQAVKQDSVHIITAMLLKLESSFKSKSSNLLIFASVWLNGIIGTA